MRARDCLIALSMLVAASATTAQSDLENELILVHYERPSPQPPSVEARDRRWLRDSIVDLLSDRDRLWFDALNEQEQAEYLEPSLKMLMVPGPHLWLRQRLEFSDFARAFLEAATADGIDRSELIEHLAARSTQKLGPYELTSGGAHPWSVEASSSTLDIDLGGNPATDLPLVVDQMNAALASRDAYRVMDRMALGDVDFYLAQWKWLEPFRQGQPGRSLRLKLDVDSVAESPDRRSATALMSARIGDGPDRTTRLIEARFIRGLFGEWKYAGPGWTDLAIAKGVDYIEYLKSWTLRPILTDPSMRERDRREPWTRGSFESGRWDPPGPQIQPADEPNDDPTVLPADFFDDEGFKSVSWNRLRGPFGVEPTKIEPSVDVKALQLSRKAQLEAVDAEMRFVLRGRPDELAEYEAWVKDRDCPTCLVYREKAAGEGVQLTLWDLEAAIEDGDRVRYLNLISPADPVFFVEEWNWFTDVTERPVDSLEFEWDADEVTMSADQLSASVPVTVVWTMPNGPLREVSFPAAFHRSSSGGWKYAGRAWYVAEGDSARVLYADPHQRDEARSIIDAMPGIMEHVHAGLEWPLDEDRVQEVKLYTAMTELQYSIYPSYVDPLGGWNEPGEAIKLLDHGRGSFDIVVAHEYGHVVTFMMGPRITEAPWWALEGIAELAAAKFRGERRARMNRRLVQRWADSGNLADWDDLADFRNTPGHLMAHVYVQGEHLLGFMTAEHGRSARNAWLRALANGASADEATREALGMPFAELDAAWRASLGVGGPAEAPDAEETRQAEGRWVRGLADRGRAGPGWLDLDRWSQTADPGGRVPAGGSCGSFRSWADRSLEPD